MCKFYAVEHNPKLLECIMFKVNAEMKTVVATDREERDVNRAVVPVE
jgi:hypothetical protein